MLYRKLLTLAGMGILFFAAGCAKFPPGGSAGSGPQLVITMTVAGQINPSDFYFVVFDVSNDSLGNNGPVPVIAPPWGNGFVAAKVPPTGANAGATSFVEYTGSNPGSGYLLDTFNNNTLQTFSVTGVPVQTTPPSGGTASTLQFTVLLSQLATASISASQIQFIQVNFIATNAIPSNPNDTTVVKDFDALGDTHPGTGQLNDYITVPTAQATLFNNQTNPIEVQGDEERCNDSGGFSPINDPDVDITNWSVQVVR
jgi:hypothetical protein